MPGEFTRNSVPEYRVLKYTAIARSIAWVSLHTIKHHTRLCTCKMCLSFITNHEKREEKKTFRHIRYRRLLICHIICKFVFV